MGPNREVSATGAADPFDRGGHHAAREQPQLFLQLRTAFKSLRGKRREPQRTGSGHQ